MRGRRSGRLPAHSRRPGGRNEKPLKRVCGQEGKRNAERPASATEAAHGRPRAKSGTMDPMRPNRWAVRPRRSEGRGRMPSDPRRQGRRFMAASGREAVDLRHAGGRTEGTQKAYGLICRRQEHIAIAAKSCTALMRTGKKEPRNHLLLLYFSSLSRKWTRESDRRVRGEGNLTVKLSLKPYRQRTSERAGKHL